MNAYEIDQFLQRRRRARPAFSGRDGVSMIDVGSGSVRVRQRGRGRDTVVFVCDAPVFIEHYDTLFDLLSERYRVICLELPGMGFSLPAAGFDFSLVSQANAVEQVLHALGAERCTLAFSCVNGYLALLLGARLPELVHRLVVMQTPSWEEEKRWALAMDFRGRGWVSTPVLGQLLVAVSQRMIARRWFKKALASNTDVAEFSARSKAALDAGCGWGLASLVQAYFSAPAPQLLPVSQPSLVIWGEQDRTHQIANTNTQSVLQYFQDAESITFADAGHSPDLEQPARFVQHLIQLIER